MPYITQKRRNAIDDRLSGSIVPESEGELNYRITMLCLRYLEAQGISYANINATIGALECAKLEMYARLARPYEDIKIVDNGDVYPDFPSVLTRPVETTQMMLVRDRQKRK